MILSLGILSFQHCAGLFHVTPGSDLVPIVGWRSSMFRSLLPGVPVTITFFGAKLMVASPYQIWPPFEWFSALLANN
jgi:hypothetical protein